MSLAESSGSVWCDACGQEAAWGLLFVHPPASFFASTDVLSALCASCYSKEQVPGNLVLWQACNWRLAETAEERFEALLEAARVFWEALKDGSPHKVEEIFPTLRLAHKIGDQGRGVFGYRGVHLSNVLEGMPILERTPLYVSSPERSESAPSQSVVVVLIGAHGKAITAEDIAEAYRESLEGAEEPWGGKGGCITYGFHGDSLQVEVVRGEFSTQDDGSLWPSPPTVGQAVKGMLEEFAGELQLRERGQEIKPKNLIPGMAAHLLRGTLLNNPFTTKAGKTDRQKIQRLLESRVFCVESDTISYDRWTQIWEAADEGAAKMEDLFSPPPTRLYHS